MTDERCPECGLMAPNHRPTCVKVAPTEEVPEEVPEEEVEEESSDEEAYFEELPVKELKKLCKEANLSAKGRKADLVARLLK